MPTEEFASLVGKLFQDGHYAPLEIARLARGMGKDSLVGLIAYECEIAEEQVLASLYEDEDDDA